MDALDRLIHFSHSLECLSEFFFLVTNIILQLKEKLHITNTVSEVQDSVYTIATQENEFTVISYSEYFNDYFSRNAANTG